LSNLCEDESDVQATTARNEQSHNDKHAKNALNLFRSLHPDLRRLW